MSAENRRAAVAYYRALWSSDIDAAMDQNLAGTYREHQYTASFIRDGLKEYAAGRLREHTVARAISRWVESPNGSEIAASKEESGFV